MGHLPLRPPLRPYLQRKLCKTQGFDWLVHYILDDLCDRYYLNHDKYASEEDRKKRSYTLVKWGYSIVYYLLSSIWCFRILTETTYMPGWLGGKGDPFTYLLNKLLVS